MEANDLYNLRNLYFLIRDKNTLDEKLLTYTKEIIEEIIFHQDPNDPFELKEPTDYEPPNELRGLKHQESHFVARVTIKKNKGEIYLGKVLLFTVIEYPDHSFNGLEDGELTEDFKINIGEEFGFKSEEIVHESIYCSEAMNGQELYAELVSDSQEALNVISSSLQKANPNTRDDIDNWIKENNIVVIETENSLGLLDEYLIEVK